MIKVALIGRPNVGKSTLFNQLCRKKLAIIDNIPGITRDIREHFVTLNDDLQFILMDTAGWECNASCYIASLAIEKTINLINKADIILFLLDGKENITNDDLALINIIRKSDQYTILVVNKSESIVQITHNDLYELGLGAPIFISAKQSLGFDHLYHALKVAFDDKTNIDNNLNNIPSAELILPKKTQDVKTNGSANEHIKLAIVGKPNVGKSTLFNTLLGFERSIVCNEPGTTRDAIYYDLVTDCDTTTFIDTAGMRRKAKVHDSIENMALAQSITAIRGAHIVALVMDATQGLQKQDMAIAQLAMNEGKGVIVIFNKCDLLDPNQVRDLIKMAKQCLYDIDEKYVLSISAAKRQNIKQIIHAMHDIYLRWNITLPTGQLNRWMKKALTIHSPPIVQRGQRLKLKYITQVRTRPPTFQIFTNFPSAVPIDYSKYLARSIKENFDLHGFPVRLCFAATDNPYS